jgi:hypothetical protein
MKLLVVVLIGFCWGSLATAAGLSFSFEFRRSGDRLVKVAVTSDQSGSLIRTLVIDVKANGAASESLRDRQRSLTAEETAHLQELVAAVRPPVARREIIAEGSIWIFKNNSESTSDEPLVFRSPTFKPKERQLEEIRLLGDYIWKIEALRQDAGRLW